MRDAQFELELDQRRKDASSLRAQLAPRHRAEAEVLRALEAAHERHETTTAAATAETATHEREAGLAAAQLELLQAGLSRSRRLWVRILEPWLLSTMLFTGLACVGLAPKPADTMKASAMAAVVAGVAGLLLRSARGR